MARVQSQNHTVEELALTVVPALQRIKHKRKKKARSPVLYLFRLTLFFPHQNLCTVISAASKFAQLQHLWKLKDSEAVSALTWGLSAYTCASKATSLQGPGSINVGGFSCILLLL